MLWRNDYSNFFESPGDYFTTIGIASFAYDQRGFGRGAGRGSWAEINQYTRDLVEFTLLILDHYPGVPLYLLGESMGAAVIIVAMTGVSPPIADGVILSSPAVWSFGTIPWYQRAGLCWPATPLHGCICRARACISSHRIICKCSMRLFMTLSW